MANPFPPGYTDNLFKFGRASGLPLNTERVIWNTSAEYNGILSGESAVSIVSTSDLDLASADQEDIGALISVAPQDIRSIKVLKDAASTAVWGSRGANGVILIETIKGDKGNISYFYNINSCCNDIDSFKITVF